MKKFYAIILLTFCLLSHTFAQKVILKGIIKDNKGEIIPFASVYLKNTSNGTSANIDGAYILNLKKGDNEIVFKAIGYKPLEKSLSIAENTDLNIVLTPENYTLNTVNIKVGSEDPAYEIIRKTIRKRKAHLNEVDAFSCNVYIKGLQKLLQAPKKFLGKDIDKITKESGLDSNRTGIIYLSESESIYSFQQPNLVHEEMISSKVSGSNRAFSFNRASELKVNFYDNYQVWEGLSLRPLVSPISDYALLYYNYKYLGASNENGITINKIEVTPKRNGDPAFTGNLYIIEDEWRLSNIDLYLTKKANINFVDTLHVQQQFIPVKNNKWMPSSVKFDFNGSLLGFKFGGYFIAVYSNYVFDIKKPTNTFAEVLRITKNINKKDSAYWANIRPIPLTETEVNDYAKKSILAQKRESKPYLDSLDKADNRFKPLSFVFGSGYLHRNRYKKENYHFSSLKQAAFFNTVEGFGLNYTASYSKQIDSASNKNLSLSAKLRYGFSSKKLYPAINANWQIGKLNYGFSVGGDILDLNNLGSISAFGNSFNSLIYKRNVLKLYENQFANLSASGRIYNGLTGVFFTEFANRKWLPNTSNYSLNKNNETTYDSNNPFSPQSDFPLFEENQSFKIGVKVSYNFSNKYITYPTGRYYLKSKYPKLTIGYAKALKNIFGSDASYDFTYTELAQENIPLGFYGKFSFMAGAGKFFNVKKIYYTDFKHFVGNQTLSYQDKPNAFMFLNYYLQSTADEFIELHALHNFSGFILNKVPLIKKLKLQELIGANYLSTPTLNKHTELYLGLQYLALKAYYGWAFENNTQVNKGFKITYTVGF